MTSNSPIPGLADFRHLVNAATDWLNKDAAVRNDYYLKRNAQRLEIDVFKALNAVAQGTVFKGQIQRISGQRFPDIVVAGRYGVEVKSAKDDRWLGLGGSVNESTRVEGVEHVDLIFGKLSGSVEFRCRPYEDCLSHVVVTHYPRYKIDMNLGQSQTIFHQMNTRYDVLRRSENPVSQIVRHYKSQLGEGESLWWTGDADQGEAIEEPGFMTIKLFNTLPLTEKCRIRCMALALFPEILGRSGKKYGRFVLWLAANHRVVSASTRDIFTAGGRRSIIAGGEEYANVPQIFAHIQEKKGDIAAHIAAADKSLLQETWRTNVIKPNRLAQWCGLAASHCTVKGLDVQEMLTRIFGE